MAVLSLRYPDPDPLVPAAAPCWRPLLAVAGLLASAAAQAYVGWMPHLPPTAPSPRAAPAMVFDAARGRVVLFGGWSNSSASCCALADTWEWDGAAWLPRQPAAAPPARAGAAAVYDRLRQRVVLFGGGDFSTSYADTWEWDGSNWTQRLPAASPPARMLAGAAFDPGLGATVLFGGYDGANYLDDTWLWNGTNWLPTAAAPRPAPRKQMAMVFDPVASAIVLFGGEQGPGSFFSDTWTWSGGNWTQRATGTSPGPRWACGAAFDPMHGRTVLFGGFRPAGITDEVWEWDGATWSLRGAVQSPLPRQNPGFVFQPTGEAVMFGGLAVAGGGAFGDTWGFRAGYPAHFGRFGSGCAGSAGTPELLAQAGAPPLPWLGTNFGLRITNVPAAPLPPLALLGWSSATYQGFGLPLPLATFGMPGCSLLCSAEISLFTPFGGPAAFAIAIPSTMSVLGTQLYSQAVVFDAGANPLGATVSNACELVIGSR